jgi:hypothetical protein
MQDGDGGGGGGGFQPEAGRRWPNGVGTPHYPKGPIGCFSLLRGKLKEVYVWGSAEESRPVAQWPCLVGADCSRMPVYICCK